MLKHENFEPQPHSHWEVGPGVPGPQGTNTPHDITRGARAGTSARMRTRPSFSLGLLWQASSRFCSCKTQTFTRFWASFFLKEYTIGFRNL